METLKKYTNLYKISKTLKFELKPIGKTLENINSNNILLSDEEKSIKSKEIKKMLDEYYKIEIDEIFNENIFEQNIIEKYYEYLTNKNFDDLEKIKNDMKNIIISRFSRKLEFKSGNGKIKEESTLKFLTSSLIFPCLEKYLQEQNRFEDIKKVNIFMKYTTYFTEFFTSRHFIFSGKEKGSIAYRMIDENLPIFLNNIRVYLENVPLEIKKNFNQSNNSIMLEKKETFNRILTQKGIDEYNLLLAGKSESNGNKIQGLNEIINLYNQNKKEKVPFLKMLNKQILSDKITSSFVLDIIEDDKSVFDIIDDYLKNNSFNNYFSSDGIDANKIYIRNGLNLSTLSKQLLENWNDINNLLNTYYEINIDNKITNKTFEEKRSKYFKNITEYSIDFLSKLTNKNVFDYFKILSDDYILKINKSIYDYKNIDKLLVNNLRKDEKTVETIKIILDSIKEYQAFLNQFINKNVNNEKDSIFYNIFDSEYNSLKEIIPIYNKIRNYLTKKPFNTNKIKLNFNCSTLLDGWDLNKEKDNLGIILKKYDSVIKKDIYFLGIMRDKKTFDNITDINPDNYYEKMEYKLLPGANKMLPKLFISAKEYANNLSAEFKENYKNGKHTKDHLDKEFLTEYIQYMQNCLKKKYDKEFSFEYKDPKSYSQIDSFYRDVEEQGYNLKFRKISTDFINNCIDENKLYLFQIYSKDFSKYSNGLPNTQTIYLESLFGKENLQNSIIKLNGQAEIFYRKKSLERKETHPANVILENKNSQNSKKTSKFDYALIKDKRYTEDKYLFHFPITINFKSYNFNNINVFINNNIEDFKYVVGIDRGERNLVYLVVSDLDGNIKEQISLNEIVNNYQPTNGQNNEYRTNYNELLDKKSKQRDEEKQSWQEIETIKELKEGYISQVVNKIKELALKYNAMIVLENLNFGFKNSRIKVEKQVYQRLETQLISKLNYVIDKKDPNTYLHGMQLTNQITTLDKIGSQSGIILYIPAWNTSKIDPTTGFVNLIYGLKYQNIDESKKFINKIKDIRFTGDYYEFDIDFIDFNPKYNNTKTDWTVCTFGNRVETILNNNEWVSKEIKLTEEFNKLFKEYNIEKDFKQSCIEQTKVDFFKKFIYLFKLTLQIRNSITGTTTDYMISPVKNKFNKFFNTNDGIETLPKDADANGAYNIARKGIMLINKIKNTPLGQKIDYKITNEEYLEYLQNK